MRQPEGFIDPEKQHLVRCGLKQSPREVTFNGTVDMLLAENVYPILLTSSIISTQDNRISGLQFADRASQKAQLANCKLMPS